MNAEVYQLDQWVQIPGTFESPEHFPDYIAVAAEECFGSLSQGSSSPETYISTDENNFGFLEDLPHVNEEVANEIVNDIVYEDPSFGSVLFDGDINDILNVESDSSDGNDVLKSECFGNFTNNVLFTDTGSPTRRKQRIVPKNEPFDRGMSSYCLNDSALTMNSRSLKRSFGNSDGEKYVVSKKLIRTAPNYFQDESLDYENSDLHHFKSEIDLDGLRQPRVTDKDKQTGVIRQRKRGLTQEERKERKKQSNRNASYRYRQRKKDELDTFQQESTLILESFENEKQAYIDVVEEFVRCVKQALLVSDARGERRGELFLKA